MFHAHVYNNIWFIQIRNTQSRSKSGWQKKFTPSMRLVSFRRLVRPPTYHTVHEAGVVKEVGEATYLSHRPWGWCRSGGRWGRSCPPGTWGSPPPSSPAGSPHSKHTWYHAEKRPESLFTNLAIDSISKSIMDLLEIPVQYRYFVQWWFFSLAYKNKDIRTAPPLSSW